MAENENRQRPVRKLAVDDFSIIKHAELEFGKITVLIGPQSSGKSLLCKLAHFLGHQIIHIAINWVANRADYEAFVAAIQREFTEWFPRGGWGPGPWSATYSSDRFVATASHTVPTQLSDSASIQLSGEFKDAYNRLLKTVDDELQEKGFAPPSQILQSLAATRLREVAGRGVWDSSVFIPLERSYFVDIAKGYRLLGRETDPLFEQFAPACADSLNPDLEMMRVAKYLHGKVVNGAGGPGFRFNDGRILPLRFLSSGSKQMLPILSLLDMYQNQRMNPSWKLTTDNFSQLNVWSFDDFTIEEPEASIFPNTQYELVQEISALANQADFGPHFTITTHSPYILTAFNDLIKAGQAAKARPEMAVEIEKIVPRQYWIKEEDFAAYAFDGKDRILHPIMDKETGLINGDVLDDVSETISDEFGQLLEIQYGD